MTPLKVLLVDDHKMFRDGIKRILLDHPTGFTVGEASTGAEALMRVRAEGWNAVALDISLPDRTGLDVLQAIKTEQPGLPVLMLTMHAEEQYAARALQAGAAGYLTKEGAGDELILALHRVSRGERYLDPSIAEKVAFGMLRNESARHSLLSKREFQVFLLLASGASTTEIAEQLYLSPKTISTHRTRILQKMRMKSNADLIRYAIENNLV